MASRQVLRGFRDFNSHATGRAWYSFASSTSSRLSRPKCTRLSATPLPMTGWHSLTFGTRGLHSTRAVRDSSFTNLLADDGNPPPVQVSSISDAGIQLADGLILPGACMFLEGKVFLWDVPNTDLKSKITAERWNGWNGELFQILEVVTPKPEMLLLGTGKTLVPPPAFLRSYLSGLGIQLEIMDTRNACSTYNLLSEEGRRVAAALLPFKPYTWPKTTQP
ncbi:NADH dehydrogenase [ubiquinone] 1 alpha subcomplex assembly factor 3 [Psilocybe cubensis]|uniref:NADH dehydrogenase [ubiquinone] 1 alpha subcomplex assembly factor 3 n=2 Tax=Psilocybe cubensis TaxID=181762 RepID=A0A8H7XZJ6_PSICU|nr:NADH dehydrogenase [ubiquinone] 1 alpha subcomplex assembly factor 3 [Psilocybe cubensis]KAH9482196.1 NADH dehydrogenase [ubiquinone] 1 alpha subcomplex assembly factor 3 [Psilocybe cubensis]